MRQRSVLIVAGFAIFPWRSRYVSIGAARVGRVVVAAGRARGTLTRVARLAANSAPWKARSPEGGGESGLLTCGKD